MWVDFAYIFLGFRQGQPTFFLSGKYFANSNSCLMTKAKQLLLFIKENVIKSQN